MAGNAEQLEMLGRAADPLSVELQEEVARRCKSRKEAWRQCFEQSGLACKQVYGPLDIPQPNFTKMLNGQAFPDPDLLKDFMKLCGNIIPVRYDALITGHELKPIQTDAEARIAKLEAELAEERQLNRRLVQLVRGT